MSNIDRAHSPAWASLPVIGLNEDPDGYDIDARTPNGEQHLQAFAERSAAARQAAGLQARTVSYADHSLAVADVFRPGHGTVRGTVVFVHGGYWKGAGRPNRAFLAPAWVAEGVQWVNLGYPVAPETPLPEICRLTRGAMLAMMRGDAPFGGMDGPIVLSGNSAGAHLVAHALLEPQLQAAAAGRLAGCMLLSGLYDLEPLVSLPANAWMRLDARLAAELSPLRHDVPSLDAPVLVTVGADEPDAFIGQSRAYARHLLGRVEIDYREVDGRNHMTMISALESPDAVLGRIVAGWLGLRADGQ
ncbi:alpha/beta hydrolase [Pigmentiphaga sp.]|jgi:Esterase/lipase|uniref:alpha/beta hydrolase n=1 Tax=Pigmentiphaga sp. TaxID=1977564 RepID=UPI0025E6D533|nr:alpha/beta hydrolase [Pigmentiphaga sp.]MBX6319678.1 alpha/beta hydrolase [Pigmentiphaga sp.]